MRDPSRAFGGLSSLTFLAGDASFRRYHRFSKDGQSYILMDAPPPENPQRFCEVSDYLRSYGFSAPQTFQKDLEQGYLVLEDLGDQTFTRYLEAGNDPVKLYNLAIDVLIDLHRKAKMRPDFLEPYSLDLLMQEVEIYLEWYCPKLAARCQTAFIDAWSYAFKQALESPAAVVLRDFHVDNLMWLEGRSGLAQCGLLDFQDAVWGPKVYDVVSLVEDARRDMPADLVESLWNRYLAAFPEDDASQLREAGTILSAGRHLKILGIFTRLHVRDGKPHYLKHIPRVERLFRECLREPCLLPIKEWFKAYAD